MNKKQCSICLEELDENNQNNETLICNHVFHEKCITEWFKYSNSCPNCRETIQQNNPHIITHNNLIHNYSLQFNIDFTTSYNQNQSNINNISYYHYFKVYFKELYKYIFNDTMYCFITINYIISIILIRFNTFDSLNIKQNSNLILCNNILTQMYKFLYYLHTFYIIMIITYYLKKSQNYRRDTQPNIEHLYIRYNYTTYTTNNSVYATD